ncbi:nucleotidyltransferase domain-containing protein [Sphingobium sp. AS12]|uniref:nucleotidyltransferase domain-containing protein n=1 Tax=Sphingobium sp. AS12 TaxID=2849495 RepID=UPI001C31E9EB|nr:nucleotidyltransferase domain-containing protein [Sphingobium sp. AS12]MBV2146757.1 nucleotidyltransferase domain-containing protein [Sphingobium sp. AS12]
MMGLSQKCVAAIRDWAESEPLILQAYVFGSRAKGVHRAESDIDLAIKVYGATVGEALANGIFEKGRWLSDLQARLPMTVDLQPMQDDDIVVTPAVIDHGILVFDRG